MSRYRHCKARRQTTIPTQIGSRSLSMLDQVKFCVRSGRLTLIINAIDFRANRPSDVVSTLVSIYDSKDLFVKELQVLLAQRLLAATDGNYEKEVASVIRVIFGGCYRSLCDTASKFRDPQDSFRRRPVASLRGHAQRHDGFKADRSACPVSKLGECTKLDCCAPALIFPSP
jgi:hypothetical protein